MLPREVEIEEAPLVELIIVSLEGEERQPIPQYWGNSDVVHHVLSVLNEAGIPSREILIRSEEDLADVRGPGVLAFPNARYLRGRKIYLASLLDAMGVAYVGCTSAGHANENKYLMKARLIENGLPTPASRLLNSFEDIDYLPELGYPLILKPNTGTESYGVFKVSDLSSTREAANDIVGRFGWPILAERWARSREFTVGVFGYGKSRTAFPIEISIHAAAGFLDEETKLNHPESTFTALAEGPLKRRVASLARQVAECLYVRDAVRIEILEDEIGNLNVIDVNTLPGLRPGPHHTSYLPACLAMNAGLSYEESVVYLVSTACYRLRLTLPSNVPQAWDFGSTK